MKTLVMREKILEKIRDVHIKLPMSHLCSSVSNLVPIQYLDIVLLP